MHGSRITLYPLSVTTTQTLFLGPELMGASSPDEFPIQPSRIEFDAGLPGLCNGGDSLTAQGSGVVETTEKAVRL